MTKAESTIASIIDDERTFEKEYIEAMQQHAIEFAEWTIKERWMKVTDTTWRKYIGNGKCEWGTTEQLYEIFNNPKP